MLHASFARCQASAPLVLATALRSPHSLALALQAQLAVQLPPHFLRKLRARPNLSDRLVRALRTAPAAPATHEKSVHWAVGGNCVR